MNNNNNNYTIPCDLLNQFNGPLYIWNKICEYEYLFDLYLKNYPNYSISEKQRELDNIYDYICYLHREFNITEFNVPKKLNILYVILDKIRFFYSNQSTTTAITSINANK